jgi:micrococcal nuclease
VTSSTRRHVVALVFALALVAFAGCVAVGPAPGDETDVSTPDRPATTVSGPSSSLGEGVEATVTRVVDGDTVEVRLANGTTETVRLLGVDTPEIFSENTPDEFEGVPETAAGRACLRRYGDAASEFATEAIADMSVRLVFDVGSDRRGYYGRLLAYVYVEGKSTSFNYRLVTEGYARVFESDITRLGAYLDAEEDARGRGVGLWSCAKTPEEAGPEPGGKDALVVATVVADAPGNDNQNLNDEYVILRNDGDRTLDLSGWTVTDDAGHRYAFPDGTTLAPGESVTLHTGVGEDRDGHRYWGRTGAVWNNGGDTVFVRDDSGSVITRESY